MTVYLKTEREVNVFFTRVRAHAKVPARVTASENPKGFRLDTKAKTLKFVFPTPKEADRFAGAILRENPSLDVNCEVSSESSEVTLRVTEIM